MNSCLLIDGVREIDFVSRALIFEIDFQHSSAHQRKEARVPHAKHNDTTGQ